MLFDTRPRDATRPRPPIVGVTEAGTPRGGTIKSSVGIGIILDSGIGDTIRVSLTGDPVDEVRVGIGLLRALRLRPGPNLKSCPTCGRTKCDVLGLADAVEDALSRSEADITVAVMGCEVNGPDEARDADIGIAGGKAGGTLFVRGRTPHRFGPDELLDALLSEIDHIS